MILFTRQAPCNLWAAPPSDSSETQIPSWILRSVQSLQDAITDRRLLGSYWGGASSNRWEPGNLERLKLSNSISDEIFLSHELGHKLFLLFRCSN